MKFTITFHTPFHIAAGGAAEGLDRLIDTDNPLPSTGLKGVMRAAATETLHLDPAMVTAVYGHPGSPSPWWWSDASFTKPPQFRNITQVHIDDVTGTADEGFLMFGQHVWATTATFEIAQQLHVATDQLPTHGLVLKACARAVVSLGGQRRRGEGWVSIDAGSWTSADTTALLDLVRVKEEQS